jgi:uncharacterized protein (DUF433 family)
MKPAIHDRGRGPEIVGSRITVYDVLDETRAGRTVDVLAREWRLSIEQIEYALAYINEHREQVERDWAEIQRLNAIERVESEARVAAILASRKPKSSELLTRFEKVKAEMKARHARNPDRCESSGANGTSESLSRERQME